MQVILKSARSCVTADLLPLPLTAGVPTPLPSFVDASAAAGLFFPEPERPLTKTDALLLAVSAVVVDSLAVAVTDVVDPAVVGADADAPFFNLDFFFLSFPLLVLPKLLSGLLSFATATARVGVVGVSCSGDSFALLLLFDFDDDTDDLSAFLLEGGVPPDELAPFDNLPPLLGVELALARALLDLGDAALVTKEVSFLAAPAVCLADDRSFLPAPVAFPIVFPPCKVPRALLVDTARRFGTKLPARRCCWTAAAATLRCTCSCCSVIHTRVPCRRHALGVEMITN